MTDRVRCSRTVFGNGIGFGGSLCSRTMTIMRDGKPWCSLHDPSAVAAKRVKQETKWKAEREAQEAVREAAIKLATELGVGRPEFSTLSGRGRYTGSLVVSAEEARRLIERLGRY